MSIAAITYLMIGAIGVLVMMGLPLAFVTGFIAVVAGWLAFGPAVLDLITGRIYSFMNEYVLVAVPMFILMASRCRRLPRRRSWPR
jgi:TRAP-type mannitol/chloroaromatic compound transport system permease large subunit